MAFEIRGGKAKVDGIAVTKGTKENAEKKLFVDLSIAGVSSAVAHGILGGSNAAEVEEAFFEPGEIGRDPAFKGLQKLISQSFYESSHMVRFGELGESMRVARIGHFVLIPRARATFDLECKIAIDSPPEGVIDHLADQLNAEVEFELTSAELPLSGGQVREPKVNQRGKVSRRHGDDNGAGADATTH